jgi:hypothetical protein
MRGMPLFDTSCRHNLKIVEDAVIANSAQYFYQASVDQMCQPELCHVFLVLCEQNHYD